MAFKLNRQQLEADEQNILPAAGEYPFRVVSAEEKANSKSSDGKMLALSIMIRTEDGVVSKVPDYLGQWQNGPKKMLSFLDSISIDPDSDWKAADAVNKTGLVVVKHGEFNGKPKLEVDFYVPAVSADDTDFSGLEPVDDEDVPF